MQPKLKRGALLLALFWPVVTAMVGEWSTDDDMGHGFFVPVVAGYIVWQRREELAGLPVRPHWLGYPLIVLAPSSIPECYRLTVKAFELAARFRVPVILLTAWTHLETAVDLVKAGAAEALSYGAGLLSLRTDSGNPFNSHFHTGINARRWLLTRDGIGDAAYRMVLERRL